VIARAQNLAISKNSKERGNVSPAPISRLRQAHTRKRVKPKRHKEPRSGEEANSVGVAIF
jgi:hypothetical protein